MEFYTFNHISSSDFLFSTSGKCQNFQTFSQYLKCPDFRFWTIYECLKFSGFFPLGHSEKVQNFKIFDLSYFIDKTECMYFDLYFKLSCMVNQIKLNAVVMSQNGLGDKKKVCMDTYLTIQT